MESVEDALTPTHHIFLNTVRQMFSLPEFLIPYVWAEAQFRSNNYQMSANSQLEHMFTDTLSTFIRSTRSKCILTTGLRGNKDDYCFNDLDLSHKEAQNLRACLTFFWTAGQGDDFKDPLVDTSNFDHTIVLVYTPDPPLGHLALPVLDSAKSQGVISAKARPLTPKSFDMPSHNKPETRVVAGNFNDNRSIFTALQVWTKDEFAEVTLSSVISLFRDDFINSDLLLVTPTSKQMKQVRDLSGMQLRLDFAYKDDKVPSGIYLLPAQWLRNLPVESNNRAHYVSYEATLNLVNQAMESGLRIPMPYWPLHYLVPDRSDFFEQMRMKYTQVMRAHTSRF